jgi:hypothetical protein
VLSDAAEVAIHPFAGYARLAREPGSPWRGIAVWLLTTACFVSWTTSGALLPEHLLLNPLVWIFAPIVQSAWVAAAARAAGRKHLREVIALFYQGHLPWLAFLLVISGACLFAPEPWRVLAWSLEYHVLVALFLVTVGWCALLTYALFRAGLGLGRGRSALATVTYYLGAAATMTSWFLFTGQLLPLWGIL